MLWKELSASLVRQLIKPTLQDSWLQVTNNETKHHFSYGR